MAMALIAVAVAWVARVVPASAVVVEMATANPTARLDGVGGDDDDEFARADVTPRLAKHSRRRSTARLTRFCAATRWCQGLRHRARGFALEITEQKGVTVWLAQLAERGVEMRGDVFPGVRLRSTAAATSRVRRKAVHSWRRPPVRGRGGEPRADGLRGDVLSRCDATNPKASGDLRIGWRFSPAQRTPLESLLERGENRKPSATRRNK